MRVLAVASAAALSLAACKSTSTPPAATASPVEVKSTGIPGQAAATRVQKLSATIVAIDKAARSVTIKAADGSTETVKLGPEAQRFDEIAVGDAVLVELEQGLLLEYQPAGSEVVEPKVVVAAGKADASEAPGAVAAGGVQGTVTVTKIDAASRVVTIQTPGGRTFQVKAGPAIQLEKLKVGDHLLGTYVETVAVQLEKAKK
jgi:Cu/Ag efflux protein CusF